MDIRCIRLKPYQDNGRVLVDVQQVIPLPEAEEYQVRLSTKSRKEQDARESSRDFIKYDVTIDGKTEFRLPKRKAIFLVIKHLCSLGINPEDTSRILERPYNQLFCWLEGTVSARDFADRMTSKRTQEKKPFDARRWYCDEPVAIGKKTYVISNQFGGDIQEEVNALLQEFPDRGIAIRKSAD